MSTYVYSLCSPRHKTKIKVLVKKTGEIKEVDAVPFQFMHGNASSINYRIMDRSLRMKYVVVDRMWDAVDYRPQYCYHKPQKGYAPKVGDMVVYFPGGANPTFTDTPTYWGSESEGLAEIIEVL